MRPRAVVVLVGLVLSGVALAGCGGTAGPVAGPSPSATATATDTSPSPPAVSPTAAPTGTPTANRPPSTGILVQYGQQGGIAGLNDRLVVQQDGAYTLTRRDGVPTMGRLSGTELADLRGVLEASHFAQIPSVNPGPGGADLITYRVVYGGHEVLAVDGGIPPALRPVLSALSGIIVRHG